MVVYTMKDVFKGVNAALEKGETEKGLNLLQLLSYTPPGKPEERKKNLGLLVFEAENIEEILQWYDSLPASGVNDAAAFYKLALALKYINPLLSEWYFCKALSLKRDLFEAYTGLGDLWGKESKLDGAIIAFETALRLKPDDADLYFNIGALEYVSYRYDRAFICFQNAIRLKKDHMPALIALGLASLERGDINKGETFLRDVIALNKNTDKLDDIHRWFLLYAAMNNPAYSIGSIYRKFRRWGDYLEAHIPVAPVTAAADASKRTLRIGYVSAFFRRNPMFFFFEGILKYHDKRRFIIYCYSFAKTPDKRTAILAGQATKWRDLGGASAEKAEAAIRRDGIDILVDCDGHAPSDHLSIFARKLAPVQITYIGNPVTTGLSRINYFFTDAIAAPPGEEKYYTEKLYRLPACFCCYTPRENLPKIAPLPALKRGYLTFGSLHKTLRLNAAVIALWARVLKAAPASRIIIYNSGITNGVRTKIHALFAANGIDAARIDIRNNHQGNYKETYLTIYQEIDLALDTFPWSGHTTSCEGLTMGVPIVTLRGDRHAGRMVASVLTYIGLKEFIAENPDEYVVIAAKMAADPAYLAQLRSTMRERMLNSPLCDGPAFTAGVEEAYRKCYRDTVASL